MQTHKQCCILWFIDDDKKTYNPGVIITDIATDDEITLITYEMIKRGRNVRISTSHLVDDIRQLPPLGEPIEGIKGYTYDPWLMW